MALKKIDFASLMFKPTWIGLWFWVAAFVLQFIGLIERSGQVYSFAASAVLLFGFYTWVLADLGLHLYLWSAERTLVHRSAAKWAFAVFGAALLAIVAGRALGQLDVERAGWLLLAAGAGLWLYLLWQTPPPGKKPPRLAEDMVAPGFRPGPADRGTDRLSRVMMSVGGVYLVVVGLYALQHTWSGTVDGPIGLFLWYGWVGSTVIGLSLYLLPRLCGRSFRSEGVCRAAVILWHLGLFGSLAFASSWALLLTFAAGLLFFFNSFSVFADGLRTRPQLVGARRRSLGRFSRLSLILSQGFFLLSLLALPVWGHLPPFDAGRLVTLWTWLFVMATLVHFREVRMKSASGQLEWAVIGAWLAGLVLGLWPGLPAELGSVIAFSAAAALAVLFVTGLWHQGEGRGTRGQTGTQA